MSESLAAMLVRLRTGNHWSQAQVAGKLCELSGLPTVTRHQARLTAVGPRRASAPTKVRPDDQTLPKQQGDVRVTGRDRCEDARRLRR